MLSGLAYRAVEEDVFSPFDGQAYAPWTSWRTEPMQGPLSLVQMAILAASPHNTQPWRFHVGGNRIDVFADRGRNLGTFDPFRREMRIGLGCAVQNIVLAAPAHGFTASVMAADGPLRLDSRDKVRRVATITLKPGPVREPALYSTIPLRHTDRSAYDPTRAVPKTLTRQFTALATRYGARLDLFESGTGRAQFSQLMIDSTDAIVADAEMTADSQHSFRKGDREISSHRDGLTLDTMGLSSGTLLAAKMLPAADAVTAHRFWARQTREVHLPSTRMLGLLSIPDRYDGAGNLRTGQAWQDMHLLAVAHGLSMQPMNQPVEIADRQRQRGADATADARFADLIGTKEWQPTFAFRIGYPTRRAMPGPRRPATDCLA
jgi:nitroreductase